MKKSTLITTIAMIVVVVVALSTATYAWFSSGSATTVGGQMTTTARSGWIVYGGSATTPDSSTGAETITYTSSAPVLSFMNDLYSPVDILTDSFTTASGLSATYNQKKFYTAQQEGIGLASTATAGTPAFTHTVSESEIDNMNYMNLLLK